MDLNSYRLYQLDDNREKEFWNDCMFVFDSSALLDFYTFPKIAREQIYTNILKPHKNCFWAPSHVQYEFLKNREKVIVKPIAEQYEPLKTENLKKIEESLKQIENQTSNLQDKIKDPGVHPHFDAVEIETFNAKITEFKSHLKTMTEAVNTHINEAINEIKDLPANDDVLLAFQNSLTIGRDYTFDEVYKITEEGKYRFTYFIPPGYKDLEDPNKKGTQIFGDLIIWKQILEYGKELKKPIILICDDLKEDWCHTEKRSGGEKRIKMPREELIKEFYDFTGSSFWMYNLPQFLHLANKYWGTAISESDIKNVAEVIAIRSQNRPKIQMDLISHVVGRLPRGLSNKNPVDIEGGRAVINIGAGIEPIMHWHINWRFEIRVYNNSSFPAFNVKIESIGESHFSSLEELRPVNNVKPFEFITLLATFSQNIESVHTEADELMKKKIPLGLDGLLLKITYLDEDENEYSSYMKIEGGTTMNF